MYLFDIDEPPQFWDIRTRIMYSLQTNFLTTADMIPSLTQVGSDLRNKRYDIARFFWQQI